MNIPDFQSLMLPFLKKVSNGQEHKVRELVNALSDEFGLSEAEREETLPSGRQPIINNRVGWARTYLLKAGLLSAPKRGFVKITPRGKEVLKEDIKEIKIKFLKQFPEFNEFREIKKDSEKDTQEEDESNLSPEELIEKGYLLINASLAQELLKHLRGSDPYFFEQVIADLLSAMGYGEAQVTKKSGDGGVDGIVNQDELGLDKIFFQAKRYSENNSITASNIRDFVGTLELHGVSKGVFITTSKFPRDSEQLLKSTQKNIRLVDGVELAKLMIKHSIGVSKKKNYEIKEIDSDYFIEDS